MSPTSGSGTMTPGAGGIGVGASIAQPIPWTLLSLPRFAKIMGIPPMRFFRGSAPSIDPMPFPMLGCDDIWYKYDWQDGDKVSWMQVATTILSVEQELANLIGYYPAPMFVEEEYHKYPNPFYPEYKGWGIDVKGFLKAVDLKYGKVISQGRRNVALIGTATTGAGSLSYTDEDGDGFFETATIQLATTLTDRNEIKVYYTGRDGEPDWEIRTPRSVVITGGFARIVFDAWQLIDPDLYEDYPTADGMSAIDISTVANYVTSVDVYREYSDTTQSSVEFYWETSCELCGGAGCTACALSTQDGCFHMRDADVGLVAPTPATYDSTNAQWTISAWENSREPDALKIWYYAGAYDQRYVKGYTNEPLSDFWARIIAYVTVARLERPLCGCTNISALADKLREEYLLSTSGHSFFVTREIQDCPLGTKWGEVWAWRQIKHSVKDKRLSFALV